jgi:hypothetical protein
MISPYYLIRKRNELIALLPENWKVVVRTTKSCTQKEFHSSLLLLAA